MENRWLEKENKKQNLRKIKEWLKGIYFSITRKRENVTIVARPAFPRLIIHLHGFKSVDRKINTCCKSVFSILFYTIPSSLYLKNFQRINHPDLTKVAGIYRAESLPVH